MFWIFFCVHTSFPAENRISFLLYLNNFFNSLCQNFFRKNNIRVIYSKSMCNKIKHCSYIFDVTVEKDS